MKKIFFLTIVFIAIQCGNTAKHKFTKKDLIGLWDAKDSATNVHWYYSFDSVYFSTSIGSSVWKASYMIDDSNHFIVESEEKGKKRIDTSSLEIVNADTIIWRTRFAKETMFRIHHKR